MNTTSVSLLTTPEEALVIAEKLERAFEDDGYPIDQLVIDGGAKRRVEVLFWDLDPAEASDRVKNVLQGTSWADQLVATRLGDHDWVAKSLEGLAPVWASRIVVHGQHDRDHIPKTAISIEIEAAQAFGSGHHGSTVGCLLAIQRHLRARSPRNPVDLGTGTGVLAIALAKLTKRPVLATDIDPIATATAHNNAKANGVGPLVDCLTADGPKHASLTRRAPFDLIVANILARPLAKMAGGVAGLAGAQSTLILSGLRPIDKSRILSAYGRYGFRYITSQIVDEWLTLTLARG